MVGEAIGNVKRLGKEDVSGRGGGDVVLIVQCLVHVVCTVYVPVVYRCTKVQLVKNVLCS